MQPEYSRTVIYREVRDVKELAALVHARRKASRLTQADLAGLSGTGTRFVIDLEKGKPTVELGKVLSVLQVLGMPMTFKVPA